MSHFIQNTGDNSLSKIINGILPSKAKAMDFLVGYFYFSGMKEIYHNIQDKPMRILVGLEMDHDIMKKTSEFDFYAQQRRSSNREIREDFYKSLVNLFNQTGYFESDAEAEAFNIYFQKIKDGTLEIRKTLDPCHAKMYIFAYKDEYAEDGETPGTVITGSSNFTYSGLRANNEVNVRFHTKPEYDDAKAIFDRLWEDAVPVVDQEHIAEFEDTIRNHTWFERTPSPYLLYLRVLYEYFNIDTTQQVLTPHEITNGEFLNLKYQEDAVRLAIDTIKHHNGVIIADVVGLGKSIIGATIARNLDLRTIIIAPPHLTKQWEDYSSAFGVRARVFSRGNLEAVYNYYHDSYREGEQRLIIIDEAHAYRNEYIKDYAYVHEICQGNKVILLTATPFNNHPSDIYSMIKLFQIPTKSTLRTVDNLGRAFTELIGRYKKLKEQQRKHKISDNELKIGINTIGEEIRRIISPLVIRRSRLDLEKIPAYQEDLEMQGIRFPHVNPPSSDNGYKLGELEPLYRSTLKRICPRKTDQESVIDYYDADIQTFEQGELEGKSSQFVAARYQPLVYYKFEYYKDIVAKIQEAGFDENLFFNSQRNLASFMRTLLVRRFESSQYAFKISLGTMLNNCLRIRHWIEERQTVPIYKKGNLPDVTELYESTDDDTDSMEKQFDEEAIQKLQSKGMFEIPAKYLKQEFFDALDSDIEILTQLKNEWDAVPNSKDPKLTEFKEILKNQLDADPGRKIVVFSQFADTVAYLGEALKDADLPVFAYTSKESSRKNKDTIMKNFDAGVRANAQEDQYQVLVATDAISEGYNLHRAGTIFNYDIPYNPTRVIQRVGRINRINKKVFDELYIYNYFPSAIGETETRTKEISTLKMAMIHTIMGEDTQYLTNDEELNNYFEKQYKEAIAASESESWDTEYRTKLHQLMDTEDMRDALELPLRSKVCRWTTYGESGVIAVAKKNGDFVFKFGESERDLKNLTPKEAFEKLAAPKAEPPHKLTSSFNRIFSALKESLFVHGSEGDQEKTKRDALDKVRLMMRNSDVDKQYLKELQLAIQYDALAGFSLRQINRLRQNEYSQLPELITRTYIDRVLHNYDMISNGMEILIAAEQIQNINTNPETELSL